MRRVLIILIEKRTLGRFDVTVEYEDEILTNTDVEDNSHVCLFNLNMKLLFYRCTLMFYKHGFFFARKFRQVLFVIQAVVLAGACVHACWVASFRYYNQLDASCLTFTGGCVQPRWRD